jgi:hypothetical protein
MTTAPIPAAVIPSSTYSRCRHPEQDQESPFDALNNELGGNLMLLALLIAFDHGFAPWGRLLGSELYSTD